MSTTYMRPVISVLHPTKRLEGEHSWRFAAKQWFKTCHNPSMVQYILCVDAADYHKQEFNLPEFGHRLVTINTMRENSVDAYNCAALVATGMVLVNTMDDLLAPEAWDVRVRQFFASTRDELVLHCRSGSARDVNLFIPQIMSKSRYDRLGYVFHPSYRTAYGDDEFTQHAEQDGVVMDAPQIVFRHLHPGVGDPDRWGDDPVYAHENRPQDYEWGAENFARRKAAGWPKE